MVVVFAVCVPLSYLLEVLLDEHGGLVAGSHGLDAQHDAAVQLVAAHVATVGPLHEANNRTS